ncbi:MAG: hypothetical protein QXL94_01700, partial [Candidatus Parvarchaeum sp.]
ISMSTLINYDLMTIHGGIDWNKSEIINVTGQQLTKGLSTNKVQVKEYLVLGFGDGEYTVTSSTLILRALKSESRLSDIASFIVREKIAKTSKHKYYYPEISYHLGAKKNDR